MYLRLSLLLSVYLASVFVISQSICRKDLYGLLVPLISDHAPAQTWCSKRFPIPAVTSTVKAANRRELLGRPLLPTPANNVIERNALPLTTQGVDTRACRPVAPRQLTSSKPNAREAAWSSLVSKGGSMLAQLCTCIETPKTVWVTSRITTTSSKTTTISTSQASSTTSIAVTTTKSGATTNQPTSGQTSATTTSKPGSTSASTSGSTSSLTTTVSSSLTTSSAVATTTTSASSLTTPALTTTTSGLSTTTSMPTSSSNSITTTTSSSAPESTIADDVPFQVALTIDSPLAKRATVYVGISNGQLVIVDTQAQGASFAVNNGALRVSGGTSAVGHASSSGSLPLTVYTSRNDLPVQVTWTIGSGNKLTLSSGPLCTMNNVLYANVGPYQSYSQGCQYVTAQADAGGLSITTTTRNTKMQTTGGFISIPKTPTPVPTPTCARPAASLLVQNPSFETGDLAPWEFTGTGSNARVSSGTYVAHAGSKVALVRQVSNNGVTFRQDFDLSCVPAYTPMSVTVWYKPLSLDMIPEVGYLFCGMTVFWDYPRSTPNINYGNNRMVADDDGNYPWVSQTQTGTSPQQLVTIAVNFNCPGQFLLDDIQVTYG